MVRQALALKSVRMNLCMFQCADFHCAGNYIQYDEAKNGPSTLESESAVEQVVTETRAPKRIRRN